MTHDLPTSVWSGSFTVWGVELHCHLLSDGQRIIEAPDIERLLAVMHDGGTQGEPGDGLAAFARWRQGG